MATANVKTRLKSKEKSQKGDGDNESKRKQPLERPAPSRAPKTKATEPPRLSTAPKASSDVIEPSVDDVSEALRMADLGGSEVEELLNQAYDLNRRLKAELANRLPVGGEPTPDIPDALGRGQVGQPGSESANTQHRARVLPPLHKPNRAGGSADQCHKRPQNR